MPVAWSFILDKGFKNSWIHSYTFMNGNRLGYERFYFIVKFCFSPAADGDLYISYCASNAFVKMNRVNSFHKNFISIYMLLGNLQKEIFERKIHLKNIYIFIIIIIIISSHNDLIYIISLIKVKFTWKHVRISINQYKRKLYCAKRKRIDTKKPVDVCIPHFQNSFITDQ